MNTIKRIDTETLISVEMAAKIMCKIASHPQKVYDMIQMLAVRSLGTYNFDLYDCQLFLVACFKITLKFYEIEMKQLFWEMVGFYKYSDLEMSSAYHFIFKNFPNGAEKLLDQFITPTRESPSVPQGEINFWVDFEDKLQHFVPAEPKPETFRAPISLLPKFQKNYASAVCNSCKSLEKDPNDLFDFNMFCSDKCKEETMEIFNF